MVILRASRCESQASPRNTAFTCFHSPYPCQHLSHFNIRESHQPKAGPCTHCRAKDWRKGRAPVQALLQTLAVRRYLKEGWVMALNWPGTESLEQWGKLRHHWQQPSLVSTMPRAPKRLPCFAHWAPQGVGEEGKESRASGYCPPSGLPTATRPVTSGLPLGSAERVKTSAVFSTCAGAPRPKPCWAGCLPRPRSVPGTSGSAQPRGHLPSSRKTRGRSARRNRSQERAGAMAAASRRGEGFPPGEAPAVVMGWGIRGKLWAPNDKEISCHMGLFKITGIRCSNFAFLSWFSPHHPPQRREEPSSRHTQVIKWW